MFISDAQVHVWAPETPERPWLGGQKPHRDEPFGPDELLRQMDSAGVHRAVLVPPFWEGDRHDVVLGAASRYPDRFAVMGRPNIEEPDARQVLASWCDQPGMLGCRFSFNRPHQVDMLTEGKVAWVWDLAERSGMPLMLNIPHRLLHFVDRIAATHPGLRIAICHLGLPKGKDEEAFRDLDKLISLARRPNVSVKASALPDFTADTYPFRLLHPYLRRVYDAFGPQRIFWGTDLSRLPCSYYQAITMYTEEIPWLTADDKEWIMGKSLCRWLAWDLPAV
jgi:predicted TIM-barrel fold metal-dependent hydrolase